MIDRRTVCGLLGASLLGPSPAIARGAPAVEAIGGLAFGTGWKVVVPGGRARGRLRDGIETILARIDRRMSPWRLDSELTGFNGAKAGWRRVSGETAMLAGRALSLAQESGGAFDPTVGPLVARWGFGPIVGDARPGWTEMAVDDAALWKGRDGLTLDLCGIAKGYALDAVASWMLESGATDFLIDLGGELVGRGWHPDGRHWRVAVEDPDTGGGAAILENRDLAVATSGVRWNRFEVGGRVYSHIIDPGSRAPVDGALQSVSVLAESGADADGWATALIAAGPERGPVMAEANSVKALFLIAGQGRQRRVTTGGIDAYLIG